MSYYLMVFEPSHAPTTKRDFLAWFERQAEWSEDHDYDSADVTTPALKSWFMEMKETFPPLNGEFAPDNERIAEDENVEKHLVDYCIGRSLIYAAFGWSAAEEAYALTRKLAQKHGVGFFDVSDEANIILPDGSLME